MSTGPSGRKAEDYGDPMDMLSVQRQHNPLEVDLQTRYRVQELLILMGCKLTEALAITRSVFAHFKPSKDEVIPWHMFEAFIYEEMKRKELKHLEHLLQLNLANEFCHRRQSFVILLGGTSGTGKSTLASLLASRHGLHSVLSTDSIRQIMRSYESKQEKPSLFVSTYQAGETLQATEQNALLSSKKRVIKGYKCQADMVLSSLDVLISKYEREKQSVVIEGVHLHPEHIVQLARKHPCVIPFIIYISNASKHRQRFAVRAKHMTIDPQENKYVKYFDNIRTIQDSLCKGADKYLIPKIDNTNVDRSVATIHLTSIRVLRRLAEGEQLIDPEINKLVILSCEHERTRKQAWSSKAMNKALQPFVKQKVAKSLLLRRLLADQRKSTSHETGSSRSIFSSSSDDDEEEEDGDNSYEMESGGDDNDDGPTAASLFSLGGAKSASSLCLQEEEHQDAEQNRDYMKRMRSFTEARHQETLWRRGRSPSPIKTESRQHMLRRYHSYDDSIPIDLPKPNIGRCRSDLVAQDMEKCPPPPTLHIDDDSEASRSNVSSPGQFWDTSLWSIRSCDSDDFDQVEV